MTRSERMAPVQQVLEQGEQARARELGEGQRRLAEAEAKLAELRTYHGEYQLTSASVRKMAPASPSCAISRLSWQDWSWH